MNVMNQELFQRASRLQVALRQAKEALLPFQFCVIPVRDPAGGRTACGNCTHCLAAHAINTITEALG